MVDSGCAEGLWGPQLLKSYEVERKPVCDLTRRYAMTLARTGGGGNTSVITSIMLSSSIICSILRKFLKAAFSSSLAAGQKYVFGLEYLNLNVVVHEQNPNGKQYLSITTEKYVPASFPGQRAPHFALPDQETILDLFGNSFVLLVIGGQKTECVQLRHELEKRNVPFSTYGACCSL